MKFVKPLIISTVILAGAIVFVRLYSCRAPRAVPSKGYATDAALSEIEEAAAPKAASGTTEQAPVADATVRRMPVSADIFLERLRAKPGERVRFLLRLRIDEGFHINAHKPRQEYLIPTTVSIEQNPAISLEHVTYPSPEELRLDWTDETLLVYEGTGWLRGELRVMPGARTGRVGLTFVLRSQACTERECLPPQTLKVAVSLDVVSEPPEKEGRHAELFKSVWSDKP